ncbi:large ribosomal subunit protein mL55 [Prorops nasuta]|uniref:large ribosomal subunit protein mL55 n=1 Tax=Prorops nasuta TaxID=863751 RepID=UPI0034CEA20F
MMNMTSLLRVTQCASVLGRNLNCWSAAITRKHRKVFARTYPTALVFPDGSSINIDYHEPRKIIKLPLDLSTLTEEQRKLRLMKRIPKSKVAIKEEEDDIGFDETKYLKKRKKQ